MMLCFLSIVSIPVRYNLNASDGSTPNVARIVSIPVRYNLNMNEIRDMMYKNSFNSCKVQFEHL